MPFTKKQQIRGVRILLTVFYGFLLSSVLSHYLIHGIVQIIRTPRNPYAIAAIVVGGIILIAIGLAIHATWYVILFIFKYIFFFDFHLKLRFDNTIIMIVSGVVLICVFVLTLVVGIIRIINAAPKRVIHVTNSENALTDDHDSSKTFGSNEKSQVLTKTDSYAVAEDVARLIIELVAILFAILATFILYRYVKAKYNQVPTAEPKT